ncbi:MAG: Txe/YoeB family addiction module toxin [Clostridium sp.]|nr:Txe/YoeB family addiction module toxin [Lachnoclostridium sp.]MCM1251269.1 Txe/YoeB family addiction module toxin [Clostridium sp.]
MRLIQWDADAWDEYCGWQQKDRSMVKRINQLIKDIKRTPFDGIGKPEALKGNLSGFWSRRISNEHRLVYAVTDDVAIIISCKGHYES